MDRLGLALGVAGADDEVVGVADHAAHVELDDVDRLLVGGELGDREPASSSARLCGRRVMAPSRHLRAVEAARRDLALRPRPARGSGSAGRAATRRRISEDEMSMRGMSKKRERSADARQRRERARATSSRRTRLALGDRELGQLEHRPRLPPGRAAHWAMSPPTMKVSSSSGAASCSSRRVSTVNDGPPRRPRRARPRGRSSPATASRHSSSRTSAPGSSCDLLVRRRERPARAARGRARAGRAPPARRPGGRDAAG